MQNKTLIFIIGGILVVAGGFLLFKNFSGGMMNRSVQEKMQDQMQEEMQAKEEEMGGEKEMMSAEDMESEEMKKDENREKEDMMDKDYIGEVMAKAEDESVSVEGMLSSAGYVVVHEAKDGKPGSVIGNSSLLEGEFKGEKVMLKRALKKGEIIFVMLHKDDGDGEYEFPGDDAPIKDENGKVVVKKVMVE